MTLEEYIEKVKIEYQLTYDSKDLKEKIFEEARKVKKGNVACLSNEDVLKIILNFVPSSKEETKPVERKKNEEEIQLQLF